MPFSSDGIRLLPALFHPNYQFGMRIYNSIALFETGNQSTFTARKLGSENFRHVCAVARNRNNSSYE